MLPEKVLDICVFSKYNYANSLPISQYRAVRLAEMARDEARHGKAFKGLLDRYFGK